MSKKLECLLSILKAEADIIESINEDAPFRYKSIQKLILENGKPFLTRVESSPFKGKPKSCFQNCFQALWNYSNLSYCEGFAISNEVLLAIPHAWLVDDNCEVIDPTWDEKYTGCTYFGVVFIEEFVRKTALKTKHYGILDNDFLNDYQLLREGFPKDALHSKFHSDLYKSNQL